MSSCELVIFVSEIACLLSKCHTKEELELYASIFVQLGDTLATMITHEDFCS